MYFWMVVGGVCVILGIPCIVGAIGASWISGEPLDKTEKFVVCVGGLLLGVGIGLLCRTIPMVDNYERTQKEVQAICESKGGVFANDKCFIEGEVEVEEGEN